MISYNGVQLHSVTSHALRSRVERKNRDLKTQLGILIRIQTQFIRNSFKLEDKLPPIRFAMNTAFTQNTGFSPDYLIILIETRAPRDLCRDRRTTVDNCAFNSEIYAFLRKIETTKRLLVRSTNTSVMNIKNTA